MTLQGDKRQKLLMDHPAILIGGYEGTKFNFQELPYIREILRRAEAMTPVLREILEFRPAPRWNG